MLAMTRMLNKLPIASTHKVFIFHPMTLDNFTQWITLHEGPFRLSIFLGLLIGLIALETIFPRKSRTQKRPHRWLTNLLMVVIDSIILRIVFPIIAVGFALKADALGWGLFNLWNGPLWLELILAVILLDGVISVSYTHLTLPTKA